MTFNSGTIMPLIRVMVRHICSLILTNLSSLNEFCFSFSFFFKVEKKKKNECKDKVSWPMNLLLCGIAQNGRMHWTTKTPLLKLSDNSRQHPFEGEEM